MTQPLTRLLAASLVALSALLAGCGESTTPAADREITTSTTTSVPATAYTVEQLATTVGCTPQFQGRTKDFRQAACTVDGDDFVLLDFDTTDGQAAWLETATMYGGIYLSGERWVLSGRSEEYLEELRATLGGVIEKSGGS